MHTRSFSSDRTWRGARGGGHHTDAAASRILLPASRISAALGIGRCPDESAAAPGPLPAYATADDAPPEPGSWHVPKIEFSPGVMTHTRFAVARGGQGERTSLASPAHRPGTHWGPCSQSPRFAGLRSTSPRAWVGTSSLAWAAGCSQWRQDPRTHTCWTRTLRWSRTVSSERSTSRAAECVTLVAENALASRSCHEAHLMRGAP